MINQQVKKVWGIPVLLGLLTLTGLLSALLGTGVWYPVSWGMMLIPLAIILWKTIMGANNISKK